jgi:hypothetical protein
MPIVVFDRKICRKDRIYLLFVLFSIDDTIVVFYRKICSKDRIYLLFVIFIIWMAYMPRVVLDWKFYPKYRIYLLFVLFSS